MLAGSVLVAVFVGVAEHTRDLGKGNRGWMTTLGCEGIVFSRFAGPQVYPHHSPLNP